MTHERVKRRDVETDGTVPYASEPTRCTEARQLSLEGNNYVAFARDRIGIFAVDGKIAIVPKEFRSRG
jgi:hypothetical protein